MSKKIDSQVIENKKTLSVAERYLYGLLIIIAIALVPFVSYLKTTAFLVFPFVLVLEFVLFLCIKEKLVKKDYTELFKDSKKVTIIKNIAMGGFVVGLIGILGMVFYIIRDLIQNSAFSFIYEVMSLNIVSAVLFILLVIVIYNFTKKSIEDNSDDKEEAKDLLFKNVSENKSLEKIIYALFVVITCVIPFAYAYLSNQAMLVINIWVIGCISNLVFGILTSLVLRMLKYNELSYKILGLVLMIITLIGTVSKVTAFMVAYISFLVTILIAFLLLGFYNKKPKDCAYLMIIVQILIIFLLPRLM